MKGKMAFIGAITTPVPIGMFGPPIMKDLLFAGSHIGGPKKIKEMVDFVAEKKIKVPVEVYDFKELDACLAKMRSGTQNGRMVMKW
ncbi:hypothetical protein CYMTET_34438 [Cymbomonas tetramitiformis]|nr:hypothetical protein CYMTET_34438 [Cymbomonas tetramitiformis]